MCQDNARPQNHSLEMGEECLTLFKRKMKRPYNALHMSATTKNAKNPQVGVFWLIARKIIAFSQPLEHVHVVAGAQDSDFGHDPLWPKVVQRFPKLRGKEYWQVPRGRVLYRVKEELFVIFGPARVVSNKRLVAQIAREFNLPIGQYRGIADMHYDPPPADLDD